jgi:hypothetical protein
MSDSSTTPPETGNPAVDEALVAAAGDGTETLGEQFQKLSQAQEVLTTVLNTPQAQSSDNAA